MGRRPDSTLGKRYIVIGMLTASMMNKQIVRHFQASASTISSLRTKIRRISSVENRNHADRSRKTTRREDIDKMTSFRRKRFLSRARIPGLVKMPRELGFEPKHIKDDCMVRVCADVAHTLVFR